MLIVKIYFLWYEFNLESKSHVLESLQINDFF
jgi:hypothetical protein